MSNGKKCRLEIMSKVKKAELDIMSNEELGPRLQQAQGAQQEGHGGSVAKLDGELQQQESQTFNPIRHFVPFNVLSHSAFFSIRRFLQAKFLTIRPFVPVDIFSIHCWVPFGVLSFDVLSLDVFFTVGVFYFDICRWTVLCAYLLQILCKTIIYLCIYIYI